MSEHDVPAERGRDELRERLATTLAALVALRDVVRDSGKLNGMEYDELGVEVNRAIEKAEAALASQETREPDGWAIRMRDGSWRSTIYEDRETAERKAVKAREFFAGRGNEEENEFDSIDVLPVYLGAPAQAEATDADSPKWATRRIAELAERDFERVNTPAEEATERSES